MIKYRPVRWLLIFITTLLMSIVIPQLIRMASESASQYDFSYYSSVLRQFSFIRVSEKDIVREDARGLTYTEAEFDSILPLFYYRQMITDGRMPDSIHGEIISVDRIKKGAFYFRIKPRDVHRPQIQLYPMYESMSGRVKLEVPDDVFRCSEELEFIDVESNTVNMDKSRRFQQALERAGFQFPAQWVAGIPTARKAYDEGYFIKDGAGHVFHLKQVNGKPFVNKTGMGDDLDIIHFSMQEAADRRFYGFAFDAQQNMYMVETGTYALKPLPFRFNLNEESMMIMANMLYWTVNITSEQGRRSIAVNNRTLEKVDEVFQKAEADSWDQLSQWIIPFRIDMEHRNTAYVYPRIVLSSPLSLLPGVILALIWAVVNRKYRRKSSYLPGVGWILVTGVMGIISLAFYRK